ncbi:hypothetical protein RLOatenuis_7130 [Rickettsiales bacterium]|nr:hypothetical protein RLOatenuis_7130 [Rickettsiales bacterium]
MDPESIQQVAKFKLAAWGTLGVLCAILGTPYMLTEKALSFLEDALERLWSAAKRASTLSLVPIIAAGFGVVMSYIVVACAFLASFFPGVLFEMAAREMLLGPRGADKDAELTLVERARFERDTGVEYKSLEQSEKVRSELAESKESSLCEQPSLPPKARSNATQNIDNMRKKDEYPPDAKMPAGKIHAMKHGQRHNAERYSGIHGKH